jgi:hypothetical protein
MQKTPGDFVEDTRTNVSSAPMAATLAPSTDVPAYTPKRTFLDKLGLVADAFSGNNNNANQLREQDQQGFQQWQATAGQQLEDARRFAQFQQQYDYQTAHPRPKEDDAFTQTLRNAGIDPQSAQGKALYLQRANTQASPAPNFVSDGAGGGRWVTPPSMGMGAGTPPAAPVGKLTPLGGGGAPSQGARTFPVR